MTVQIKSLALYRFEPESSHHPRGFEIMMQYAGKLRKRSELASTGNSHFLATRYKEVTAVFQGKKRARVMRSLECPKQVRNLFEADDRALIPFTFVNDEEAVKKNKPKEGLATWSTVKVVEVLHLIKEEKWCEWASRHETSQHKILELYKVRLYYLQDPEQKIHLSEQYRLHFDGTPGINQEAWDTYEVSSPCDPRSAVFGATGLPAILRDVLKAENKWTVTDKCQCQWPDALL